MRARGQEFEADRDALRPHPAREMPRGVAQAGKRGEDLGEQRLVARAIAEIGRDHIGDALGLAADGGFEPREIGAPRCQLGRSIAQESRALARENGSEPVGIACRKRPQHSPGVDGIHGTPMRGPRPERSARIIHTVWPVY
jgi:hypothetical protein